MTQYGESESLDLKAKDFVGQNLKAKIAGVEMVHFVANGDQPAQDKPRLKFEGKDKGLVLNVTNVKTLIQAYGPDSDSWAGHEVGLSVQDYSDKGFPPGWVVKALDVEEPEFNDDIPF